MLIVHTRGIQFTPMRECLNRVKKKERNKLCVNMRKKKEVDKTRIIKTESSRPNSGGGCFVFMMGRGGKNDFFLQPPLGAQAQGENEMGTEERRVTRKNDEAKETKVVAW